MDYVLTQSESRLYRYETLSMVDIEPSTPGDAPKSPDILMERPSFNPIQKVSDPAPNPLVEYPEGGRQAWLTVFASACLIFLSQGGLLAFGVYQDYYTRIFLNEKTPSEIAWIGSVQLFLIFSLGLPTGKLFDEGYIRELMLAGSVIYIFSYFMLSLAKPHHFYQVFLAQGLGVGIGMGILYVPSLSILFHYFKLKRGLAVGVASLGGAIGAIVITIGLNHLINGRVGFAWGIRIYGFIFLGLAIVGNLLMKPRLPPRKLRKDNIPKPDVKKVITNVPFATLTLGASLILFAIYFPFFYVQLFAILHGTSPNFAFYTESIDLRYNIKQYLAYYIFHQLITIMNGSNMFGRVFWGFFADKFGILNAVIITCALSGIVGFTMIKATTVGGLVAFTIFYGFFSGGLFALGGPTVSVFVDSISDLGFAVGWSTFIDSFFLLVSQPVAGQLLDAPRYRWNRAIVFVNIILFIGVFFASLSRWMIRKKKTWKA